MPVDYRTLFLILATSPIIPAATITFNEFPFPTATRTYVDTNANQFSNALPVNVVNDATGTVLAINNGDRPDLSFDFVGALLNGAGRVRERWQTTSTGRFASLENFTGAAPSNNTGRRVSSTTTVTLANHQRWTNVRPVFSGLNSAGVVWEYSMIAYLRPDYTFFSPMPGMVTYANATSFTGSPSQGWFVAASTATVTGVGTNRTANGVNGTRNNLTLTPALAGLANNTPVGGFVLIHVSEDVRGISNGNASTAAYLTSVSFTNTPVPEPSTVTLLGLALFGFGAYRRRRGR